MTSNLQQTSSSSSSSTPKQQQLHSSNSDTVIGSNNGRNNSINGTANRPSHLSNAFSAAVASLPKQTTDVTSKNQQNAAQNGARARQNNKTAANNKALPGMVRIKQQLQQNSSSIVPNLPPNAKQRGPTGGGGGGGDAASTTNNNEIINDASYIWLNKLYTCLANNQIDEALRLTSPPEKLLHDHRKLIQEEAIPIVDRICEWLRHGGGSGGGHQRTTSSSSSLLPNGGAAGGGDALSSTPFENPFSTTDGDPTAAESNLLPFPSSHGGTSTGELLLLPQQTYPPSLLSQQNFPIQHDERSRFVGRLVLSNLCAQMRPREVINTILLHMDRAAGEPQYDLALLPAIKTALHAINRRKLLHMQPVIFTLIGHMRSLALRYTQDPAQCERDVNLLMPEILNFLEQTLVPEMQKTCAAAAAAAATKNADENGSAAMPPPPPPPPPPVVTISADHTAAELLAFTCFQLLSEPLFYFEIPDESSSATSSPPHAGNSNGQQQQNGGGGSHNGNGGNVMAKSARRIIALLRQTSYEFGDILNVTEFLEKCVEVDIALQPQCETELMSLNRQSLFYFMSGYWHFWYLVLVRRMEKEHLPQIFSPLFLLKQLLIICRVDFQKCLINYWTRYKVSEVLATLFGMIDRRQIKCDEVDPTTEAVPLIICLVQMSKRARSDDIHQQAHQRITEFLDLFDSEAFYLIINRACLDLKEPEAVAYMIARYKDRFIAEWAPVHAATETQQQPGQIQAGTKKVGKFFKGGLLKIFVRSLIRQRIAGNTADFDVVHESVRILATMNFLIFLFVRDSNTTNQILQQQQQQQQQQTSSSSSLASKSAVSSVVVGGGAIGIMEMEAEVNQLLIRQLWSMLEFSQKQLQHYLDNVDKGEKLENLPQHEAEFLMQLGKDEQRQYFQHCLAKIDVMQCVLAQLREKMDECKLKKQQQATKQAAANAASAASAASAAATAAAAAAVQNKPVAAAAAALPVCAVLQKPTTATKSTQSAANTTVLTAVLPASVNSSSPSPSASVPQPPNLTTNTTVTNTVPSPSSAAPKAAPAAAPPTTKPQSSLKARAAAAAAAAAASAAAAAASK